VPSADRSDALVTSIAASRGDTAATLSVIGAHRVETHACTLPSFLVLGPPRTGTTWLSDVLHSRALLPALSKETRFFDLHFDRGLNWYIDHFPVNPERRVVGEIAPTYFASSLACARICSLLPNARLVVIFRNPVQRLISLYRLKRAYGLHAWDFDAALERDSELLASSQYATHLRMWQSCFAPEQLSINFFEDLIADPQAFIDRICAFVGVSPFVLKESERREVFSTARMTEPRVYAATRAAQVVAGWCKARRLDRVVYHVRNSRAFHLLVGGGPPFSPIPRDSLAKVHAQLLRQTEELEMMVGRDLAAWKVPAEQSIGQLVPANRRVRIRLEAGGNS